MKPLKFKFNEETSMYELEKNYKKAKKLLSNEDNVERFLIRLENKFKVIPFAGNMLSNIPLLISLIRKYVKKEYTDIPLGTVIAVLSALIYFVSPIDIFPDGIPFIGLFDDAAVMSVCWKLVKNDIDEYIKWREDNPS